MGRATMDEMPQTVSSQRPEALKWDLGHRQSRLAEVVGNWGAGDLNQCHRTEQGYTWFGTKLHQNIRHPHTHTHTNKTKNKKRACARYLINSKVVYECRWTVWCWKWQKEALQVLPSNAKHLSHLHVSLLRSPSLPPSWSHAASHGGVTKAIRAAHGPHTDTKPALTDGPLSGVSGAATTQDKEKRASEAN